jgi:hypothetical protein
MAFAVQHPLQGYRRLAYRMLDAEGVAVSASSVYRVLKAAGLLKAQEVEASSKGTGFKQPERPPEHGHGDVAYLNISGTFYSLGSVLDG